MVANSCPFCSLEDRRVLIRDVNALVIRDAFPVSPGHTLVIPNRHVGSFFEVTDEERESMMRLLNEAKQGIARDCHPDGWNIGINDGATAGQTVPHLHIHLIPRYAGDSADPRGGVRWVIPGKANYWDSGSGNGNP